MSPQYERRLSRTFVLLVAGALAAQACATKGYVRNKIREEAVTTGTSVSAARDSAVMLANQARMREDSVLENRVNARTDSQVNALRNELRNELSSMRTDFNAKITMMEDSLKIGMPVNFDFDQATIRDADRPAIERFAHFAKKFYPGAQITVEGFADPAGTTGYNLSLSKKRADAVQSELASMGLDKTSVRSVGYGETRLVTPKAQKDQPGAELNRRVVFVIETAGSPMNMSAFIGQQ
ncbi:MAG TPA: OmpA family protein [Gemmatimonadaceae bacterium]|nr:OmpA family protein [Gemmatimonadaceae bacterium]